MNTEKLVIGIIITIISGGIFLLCLTLLAVDITNTKLQKYTFISFILLVIGIILIVTSSKNSRERQEYEEFKRMKEQERAIYYRYANAKGTSIDEYLMDDRTKLITYYDRMPDKYKKQLLDRADTLYRRSENEKYLNNNNQNHPM